MNTRAFLLLATSLSIAAIGLGACRSDSSDNPNGAGGDAAAKGPICDRFSGSGTPCAPVSAEVCFPMCKTGGCMCTAGPNGAGVWQCTSDFSCMPDAAPSVDGSFPQDDGAAPDDAGNDADADDGGDADADAS